MADSVTTGLSHPGPKWHILWPEGGLSNIQLDVVGFLAILGEDAVKKTSRLASLSPVFLLPRLLPAPHSLLYSERPEELDVFRASVCSVHGGDVRDHLSHVAGAIFAPLPTYVVRCVEIRRAPPLPRKGSELRGILHAFFRDNKSMKMRANLTGPHVLANVFGSVLSVILLALSITFGDGMSLLATILLSGVSVFAGITNRWQISLPDPVEVAPAGDTVIRWPNGSWLIVRCSWDVARELFFRPESIDYSLKWANGFIFLSLAGTLFLMVSVVALANAKIQLQVAWAASFIILNIAHWIAAALPRRLNWDFSAYDLVEQGILGSPYDRTFTQALWKAIVFTKSISWVKLSNAAPKTAVWDEWLAEAELQSVRCSSHVGELIEPIWSGDAPKSAVVWDVPDEWDAKTAWERISRDAEAQSRSVV